MYSKVQYGVPLKASKPMTDAEMHEFLAEPRNCILGTTNKDGSSQLTPIGFLWDGKAFYMISDKERYWVRANVQRDPRMSLVVDQGDEYRSVVVRGKAEIWDKDIDDMTRRILVKYFGEEAGSSVFEEAQRRQDENRVIVVLKPERIQTWQRDDGD